MIPPPAFRIARTSLLAAVVAVLAGCFSPVDLSTDERYLVAQRRYRLITDLDVPPVRGAEGCGAQALATVMARADPTQDAATLAETLPWHDRGATPVDLLLEARRRGYTARIAKGTWPDLAAHVERGEPVLVMLDVGYEVRLLFSRIPSSRVMHWAVVSGMADDDSRILLAAPETRHHVLRRDEFLRRWARSDECVIVVRPGAPAGSTAGRGTHAILWP